VPLKVAAGDDLAGVTGDLDGGPGTSLAALYFIGRSQITTPKEDFNWHQARLKAYLENHAAINVVASQKARELAERAQQFWYQSSQWKELPANLRTVGVTPGKGWLTYCVGKLDKAISQRNLVATQRWSGELASAAFSLEDLHRWLAFLEQNHLTALEFQQRCSGMFEPASKHLKNYDPKATISQFPAGLLSLNGINNYMEVERQAERLFSISPEEQQQVGSGAYLTAGSLWVPSELRQTYVKLRSVLSPNNQKTWDLAARSPYEHSYLINILFRTAHSGKTDDLAAVLKKFDQMHPSSKPAQLLSVLMYRSHAFAGFEWGDRFQPELVKAANEIKPSETDLQALKAACEWTYKFYSQPAEYGMTLTLRNALDQKRLDCVRATDMIGTIYNNAGRPGFCNVRWCAESNAHSVAGRVSGVGPNVKIELVDGLNPAPGPEIWPQSYFHGHAWPPTLAQDQQTPYAVELYVRGLDSYVWAQGYIIRGPNAGWLTTAEIPYGLLSQPASTKKVFNGPYPSTSSSANSLRSSSTASDYDGGQLK
jgi:hypothetical protein